jgi:hypothetical protein
MNRFFLFPFVGFFLFSCASTDVLYYGNTYATTKTIDIFTQENEIKEPFEIMGKAVYEDAISSNSELIQEKIVRVAKSKGADGVIFEDISVAYASESSAVSVTNIDVIKRQVVKIKLIKYKRNLGESKF